MLQVDAGAPAAKLPAAGAARVLFVTSRLRRPRRFPACRIAAIAALSARIGLTRRLGRAGLCTWPAPTPGLRQVPDALPRLEKKPQDKPSIQVLASLHDEVEERVVLNLEEPGRPELEGGRTGERERLAP